MRDLILKNVIKRSAMPLAPIDGRKSFYGKCEIFSVNFDNSSGVILYSYGEPVIAVIDDKPIRMWDDWSATTHRHVNAFLAKCGKGKISKAEWLKMEVVE